MKQKLINIIDKHEIVSFDIFDTLIFRNLNKPSDIFKILEKIANDKYNVKEFYKIRIESEKNSRKESNNYECNLNEIYKEISKKINNKNIVEELKKNEISLEKEFCVVNPFMKTIYDYCLQQNKKVVLISDMYLDKKIILDILNNAGYKKVELYLSNEYKENKGTSKLYEIVWNKNKFNKEKWLHIGDNYYSDYEMPIKFGINAYNYKNVSTYSDINTNSIFESIILGINNNYLNNGLENNYWENFGVRYAAPIYFGFTKWIYELTKHENNLFFLARDGYIIKEIYELLNNNSEIYTKYIYCSRKSIQIPALLNQSKDKLISAFSMGYSENSEITLKEFLINSYVNIKQINDISIIKIFGFESLEDKVNSNNIYNAKKLIAKLFDNIKENLKESKQIAIDYLKQEKLNDFEKINIMDIGWSGSIQESISKLLEKEVVGYYFGTIDSGKKDSFSNMFGYYFDLDNKLKDKEKVIENPMMYELLFSAPHGSTIQYEYNDKKIVPVLEKDLCYKEIVTKFQNSAMNIIKKYIKYLNYFDNLDKYFCIEPYQKFIEEKKLEDLKQFTQISTDYILGSNEKVCFVNEITPEELEINSKEYINKIEKSLWKETFYIKTEFENNEEYYRKVRLEYYNYKYKKLSLIPLTCAKIYLNFGNGFNENDIALIPYKKIDTNYRFEFKIPKSVTEIRIDPIEGHKIKITNLIIYTNEGNTKCSIPHKNILLGKKNKCIYINSTDPKIIINNITESTEKITFSANIEIIR